MEAITYENAIEHAASLVAACDRINGFYPAKSKKDDWQWRTHFKSSTMSIGDELSEEEIFPKLDQCLEEILEFEAELREKLASGD